MAINKRYRDLNVYVFSCFFIWGLSYGLLDVLNKHFQDTLHVGKAQSTWLQIAYFGAYLLMSVPSGMVMQAWGYKVAIVFGLLVTATGAGLFLPAAQALSFPFFVAAMFVLASGLCCLEAAAQAYVNDVGDADRASWRLNLAQAFSGLGSFAGPVIGGTVIFSPLVTHILGGPHRSVQATYGLIALGVLAFALAVSRADLSPASGVGGAANDDAFGPAAQALHRRPHFVLAVAAIVFYVGAQVGVGAFFINLATETWPGMTAQSAAFLLSMAMIVYFGGRFANTALMTRVAPDLLLAVYGLIAALLMLVVAAGITRLSALALAGAFFFMSPMLATLFGLGLADLGPATKRASSIMVMAIGGAILVPYPMGRLAEMFGAPAAFLIPAACFAMVALYAWKGARLGYADARG